MRIHTLLRCWNFGDGFRGRGDRLAPARTRRSRRLRPESASLEQRQLLTTYYGVYPQAVPSFAISDVRISEGNAGQASRYADFTVKVTNPVMGQSYSINYATVGGSAAAGSDFAATQGTLSFRVPYS